MRLHARADNDMFSVVITEKGGAQRRLDFDKSEVTIGRVQGNDIILPKGNVSKRHSRIVLKDNRFIVVDLKSTNGTYVNGRKITSPLVVKSGDKIYIGDFILTLEEAAGAGADAGASAPMGGGMGMGGPPPLSPAPMAQAAPPPMAGPPPLAPSPLAPPPTGGMGGPPPLAGSAMGAPVAPPQPSADRRPPPLRSAPPPPRQPTLAAGGMGAPAPSPMGAPPPLPARDLPPRQLAPREAPRVPSEPPPREPAAERYPIDEEPADETMAPSPRVVQPQSAPRQPTPAGARPEPAREPSPGPTDAPPRPAHAPVGAPPAPAPVPAMAPAPAPAAPAPAASAQAGPASLAAAPSRRMPAPRARDPRDPLGYVMAALADTLDVAALTPPEAIPQERWREARAQVDAAIARLEREGGSPGDRDSLASVALQEALGVGPLGALLDDPGVLEIVVEGPSTILVDRGAGLTPAPGRFSSADQLTTVVGRLVTRAGLAFDDAAALHDAMLPDGAHLVAVLPPVAMRGPLVEIRRTGRAPVTGESLVQQGLLSSEMLSALRSAVVAGRNVVVVGASEVGVATVVSMIANLAPSDDRVLAIEGSPELALAAPHTVRLGASARVSLGALIETAPRLRADRVVLDGVSGADTRAALLLLASRGSGCVLGVRSAPTGGALEHLEALASLGGAGDALGRVIASAVHVLVRVGRDRDGVRRILSIAEVTDGETGPQVNELFEHAGEFQSTGQRLPWG